MKWNSLRDVKKKLISTKSNEKYKSPDLDSSIRNGN